MRLGGPVFGDCSDPRRWVAALKSCGYRAAYCPVDNKADDAAVRAFADAAHAADIVIAEVGAWSNPMSPDEKTAREALAHCQAQLALADRIGARCCVNISGSCGAQWDGPDPRNLTRETFDRIVEVTRAIIDAVNPSRTYYTLETMPWMYPDSAESYVALLKAIDRPRFAVHLDPANLLCSPQRYFGNADLIRECFDKLGPHIRSCHAKDIALAPRLTTHLDEVRPGLGGLDYAVFLRELDKRDADIPLMLEHLQTAEEYIQAAEHIRKTAWSIGTTC
ncbi:MAG TPA: TIM barrel protein [Candidatus Hydrogenedentes bacterium]|nr:TIM barrel protein [Candidatus Hydrogenedentota bacterium]HOV74582.1 TIM barrel protein [Candidatus Hydrogenedentota bacterium]HPC16981.1 TIM barrel protein [Candidatus Hydrogenedentota bacterium]HRT20880.1 TIM barrel protein [Candidatus Hydrogenedentota bacterium]HRT66242.1 TIM barrel protein [Candidatus Hydrogenedentota bacterium]